MEKIVTILGEEVKVKFNLAVEIAFEEISQKNFALENLESVKDTIALYAAIIITNNPDSKIDMKKLIHEATAEEIGNMRSATIEVLREWCQLPEEKEQPAEEPAVEAEAE